MVHASVPRQMLDSSGLVAAPAWLPLSGFLGSQNVVGHLSTASDEQRHPAAARRSDAIPITAFLNFTMIWSWLCVSQTAHAHLVCELQVSSRNWAALLTVEAITTDSIVQQSRKPFSVGFDWSPRSFENAWRILIWPEVRPQCRECSISQTLSPGDG